MTARLESQVARKATAKPGRRDLAPPRPKRQLVELSPAVWAWGSSDELKVARRAVARFAHDEGLPAKPSGGRAVGSAVARAEVGVGLSDGGAGFPSSRRLAPPRPFAEGSLAMEGSLAGDEARVAMVAGQMSGVDRRPSSQQQRLDRLMELARVYRGWSRLQLADRLGRDPGHLVPPIGGVRFGFLGRLAEVLDWELREVVEALETDEESAPQTPAMAIGATIPASTADEVERLALPGRSEPDAAGSPATERIVGGARGDPGGVSFRDGGELLGSGLVRMLSRPSSGRGTGAPARRKGTTWDRWSHPLRVESTIPGALDAWTYAKGSFAEGLHAKGAVAEETCSDASRGTDPAGGRASDHSRGGKKRSSSEVSSPLRGGEAKVRGRTSGSQLPRGSAVDSGSLRAMPFAELDLLALAAHRDGRTDDLAELVAALCAAARDPNERAVAANREVGMWDRRGRYQLALEAAHRGLAEEGADETVRWMLQANLAHAYTTLSRLVEGESIARAVRDELEQRRPSLLPLSANPVRTPGHASAPPLTTEGRTQPLGSRDRSIVAVHAFACFVRAGALLRGLEMHAPLRMRALVEGARADLREAREAYRILGLTVLAGEARQKPAECVAADPLPEPNTGLAESGPAAEPTLQPTLQATLQPTLQASSKPASKVGPEAAPAGRSRKGRASRAAASPDGLRSRWSSGPFDAIRNSCDALILEADVALGLVTPEMAHATVLERLEEAEDLDDVPGGDWLESYGWWAVSGCTIAMRHLEGHAFHRLMAVCTNKALEIADRLDHWSLRERAFTMERFRRTRIEQTTGHQPEWVLDDEDVRILIGTMGRFPHFRQAGWHMLDSAQLFASSIDFAAIRTGDRDATSGAGGGGGGAAAPSTAPSSASCDALQRGVEKGGPKR